MDDTVNVGEYYVTAEEEYYQTYRAFDGRTGRDYVKDKTLQHPFPVAFKHFHQTIGLDPEEAHLLACGENRFELISEDFENEKRVLASKFYDYLIEQDYWGLSEVMDFEPDMILEPAAFGFLEHCWGLEESHPLHEHLKHQEAPVPTATFQMHRLHHNHLRNQALAIGDDPDEYIEIYASHNYDWESAPQEVKNYPGFVNWDIQIID